MTTDFALIARPVFTTTELAAALPRRISTEKIVGEDHRYYIKRGDLDGWLEMNRGWWSRTYPFVLECRDPRLARTLIEIWSSAFEMWIGTQDGLHFDAPTFLREPPDDVTRHASLRQISRDRECLRGGSDRLDILLRRRYRSGIYRGIDNADASRLCEAASQYLGSTRTDRETHETLLGWVLACADSRIDGDVLLDAAEEEALRLVVSDAIKSERGREILGHWCPLYMHPDDREPLMSWLLDHFPDLASVR